MTCDLTSFSSISVIKGRWTDDIERLCAIDPRLRLKRSPSHAGLEFETATKARHHQRMCRGTELFERIIKHFI